MKKLLQYWEEYLDYSLNKARLIGVTKEEFRQQIIKGQSIASFGEFMEWLRERVT